MTEGTKRTVAVGLDDDTSRKHEAVTAWAVESDGSLWLLSGNEYIAVYAPTHWRWVERTPDVR